MHSVMKPSMGVSMESQISQRDNVHGRMDMNHQKSGMLNMYRDNQEMGSNMMDYNMMGQEWSSNIRNMHRQTRLWVLILPTSTLSRMTLATMFIATMTNSLRSLRRVTTSQSRESMPIS